MRGIFTKGRHGRKPTTPAVPGCRRGASPAAARWYAWAALMLAVALALSACTPRDAAGSTEAGSLDPAETSTEPADNAGAREAVTEAEDADTPPVSAAGDAQAEVGAAESDAVETSDAAPTGAAAGRSTAENGVLPRFLLAERELTRLVPFDAEIGELTDVATAGRAYHALRHVVEGFISALHDPSRAVADYVLESERVRVGRMIESDLPADSSPRIRFGEVRWLGGDQAIIRVRLVDSAARTSGDILLERPEDEWKIADLMISLRELEPAAAGAAVRLEPWTDRSPLVAP